MASKSCDKAIVAALGREASARELGAIKRRAAALAEKMKGGNVDPKVFLDQFLDREKAARLARQRDEYNNYIAGKNLDNWRTSVPELQANPRQGLLAQLVGSKMSFQGSKDSVAARMDDASHARMGAFWTELERAGLNKLALSGKLDDHVGEAIWDIQHGMPLTGKYGSAAENLAKIYIKHKQALVSHFNDAGGHIQPSPEHIVTRSYDSGRVAQAGGHKFGSPEAVAAFVKAAEKMNWNKSFDGEFSAASKGERQKLLEGLWSDFVSGRHPQFDTGGSEAGFGRQNVAAHFAKTREIIFDTAKDEMAWLKQFNRGETLADSLTHQLSRMGADAELMKRFGANPRATFDAWYDRWDKDLHNDPSMVKERKKFRDQKAYVDKYIWPSLLRDTSLGTDNPIAKFLAVQRSGGFMVAKLGASIFSNFGDWISAASTRRFYWNQTHGEFFKGLAAQAGRMIGPGLTREEQKELATEYGILWQQVGRPSGPVAQDAWGLGSSSRFVQLAMKYFSHSWWANTIHTTKVASESYRFANAARNSFEKLRPEIQSGLKEFNIGATEWEVLRKAAPSQVGQYRMIQPSDIRAIPLDEFKTLASKTASERVLTKARNDLADSYRNMLGQRATMTTAYPSRALRALTTYGTQAGTVEGELIRGALMLKTFQLNYMRNTIGGILYGHGQGDVNLFHAFVKTLANGNARSGLVDTIVGSILVGYMRNAMWDIASGKTPQDSTTAEAFERALSFQALGLMTDFVFADAKMGNTGQPAHLAERVFDMLGPAVGNTADAADIAIDAVNEMGSPKSLNAEQRGKLERRLLSLGWHNTPGANTYWAKAALNYLVFDRLAERVNPGYKARLKQRARKNGQTYFIGP